MSAESGDDIFGAIFEADHEVSEVERLPGIVLTTLEPLSSAEFDAKYFKPYSAPPICFEDEQGNEDWK
jgi:hypothetical protein